MEPNLEKTMKKGSDRKKDWEDGEKVREELNEDEPKSLSK